MRYLITVAVGPVQEFIASARRSRDLWFGSWLLSELSKAAAYTICEGLDENLSRLIFPSVKSINDIDPKAKSDFNVVNKILAVVDNPVATSKAVGEALQERLETIRLEAYKRIPRDKLFYEDEAIAQVKDMVEFFWAAYPFEDENQYAPARNRAELLLNARKATRNFEQVRLKADGGWGDNVPKSALDGQRESVIDDRIYDMVKKGQITRGQFLRYGLRENERLCGVGLLKRNGNRANEEGFFSTSHVATLPLLKKLTTVDKQTAKQAVKNYLDKITGLLGVIEKASLQSVVGHVPKHLSHEIFQDYDGHLLFSERLREFFDEDQLKNAKEALSEFLKDALDDEKPLPYYALLLADGDNMGKAIDSIKDINRHREFSKELSAFAESVSQIVVANHSGSLVYAGGDDVLAFVPLHTVLQCARELANEFKAKLKGFAFKDSGIDYQPTLSVGVVIAHHLEPLQDALTLARKAERTAKKVEGKEALAIILSKRSGVDKTIRGSWQKIDDYEPLDQRLLNFTQLHRAGDIPDGAAYELRDLFLRLNCEKQEPEYKKLQAAMRKEAVRILGRKKIKNKNILDALTRDIESEKASVEDLANELIVARIFADAFDQAFGKVAQV